MLQSLLIIVCLLLFVPIVCKQLRLPSIVGLVLAGAAFGQFGLSLIQRSETVDLFAQIGMIYIMFLSGIEIDINDFRRSHNKSLLFGLFSFLFPAVLATAVFRLFFAYSWLTALLLGSMCGSHTLITYTAVSRYGIQRHSVVNISVGATMLAVTLSLLFLGGISAVASGNTDPMHGWKMLGWTGLFLALSIWVFPRLAAWFIKKVSDPVLEFLLIALLVALSAWLTERAGLQTILGAFVAGIALNRLIPNLSPLMNRLSFIGNAVFIPVFLLSVGMMIDVRVFLSGWLTIVLAAVLVGVKLSGKWLAAFLAQRLFRFTAAERRLMTGLTAASAAGTLAVVTIGYSVGLFTVEILNATVLLILLSCIVASFLTEHAAREIAMAEKLATLDTQEAQHVLVTLANEAHATSLMDVAFFTTPTSPSPAFTALAVIPHPDKEEKVQPMLKRVAEHANAVNIQINQLTQVAANIANGIQQVAETEKITQLITGIDIDQTQQAFSHVLQSLISNISLPILVYHHRQPLSTIKTLRVAVPRNAERETGFLHWFEQIRCLAMQTSARVVFYTNADTGALLQSLCHRPRKRLTAAFVEMLDWEDSLMIAKEMQPNDMLVMVSARKGTISYNPLFETIPHVLHDFFADYAFMVVFPEQTGATDPDSLLSDTSYMIEPERGVYVRLKRFVLKQMRKHQHLY